MGSDPRFGADEAGKGPALGPMFAAAVIAPPAAVPDAVDDSKHLAPARREDLATALRDHPAVTVSVASVPPARIDAPDTDMNELGVRAQATALRAAVAEREAERIAGVVDAADTDADRFSRRISARVPDGLSVDAAHGADETDPLVGAASVVAKVERDTHMAALARQCGDVGSGYPSDPATKAFLESYVTEHGALPACARASWATCEDALAAAEQTSVDEF